MERRRPKTKLSEHDALSIVIDNMRKRHFSSVYAATEEIIRLTGKKDASKAVRERLKKVWAE